MKGSQEMMYGGTTVSFGAWLMQQDWLLILGTLASVLGLLVTWYFKLKEERRQQALFEQQIELHEKQMQQLEQNLQEQLQRQQRYYTAASAKGGTDGTKE